MRSRAAPNCEGSRCAPRARPFWEGKFDRDGFTYNLKVIKPGEITRGQVRQVLSTMVLVPGSGGETTAGEEQTVETTEQTVAEQASTPEKQARAALRAAVKDYY